jgi:acyl carrier protein
MSVGFGEGTRAMGISDDQILEVVLQAMRATNQARDEASQLVVSADGPIFGPDSTLDSLGLVGLLLDVEEGLQAIGCDVVLSDERAVSQKRSPFRNVQSLVGYVSTLARE